MNQRRIVLFALLCAALAVAVAAAARMISVSQQLADAAAYALAHPATLPTAQPLANLTPLNQPPSVAAVARYGDAVEVQVTHRFVSPQSDDLAFTTTHFFQPLGDAWQPAPIPDSFWGDPQTTNGQQIVIEHPQRNAKLAQNLLTVADPAITEACRRWQCDVELPPIIITFSTDPRLAPTLLTRPAPQYTGVPMSLDANTLYLSSLTANAVMAKAQQLGGISPFARAYAWREIAAQGLYAYLPDDPVTQSNAPALDDIWAISAHQSPIADSAALSFVNFLIGRNELAATALQYIADSPSFAGWIERAALGDAAQLEAHWLNSLLP